jgi:hypothetical protein
MTKEKSIKISESTNLQLDLKTIVIVIGFTVSLVSVYFSLKADIAEAKELPEPTISATEFEMKDLLVRENIKNTLIITENNAKGIQELKEKLIVIENRLYELSK